MAKTARIVTQGYVRAELHPPRFSPSRVKPLVELGEAIVSAQNSGTPHSTLVEQFNAACGARLEPFDFHAAWEGDGIASLVHQALLPPAPHLPDISDAELLELIGYAKGEESSSNLSWYLRVLERHLISPRLADLIFMENLEPEEVLRRARSYRPIITPPPASGAT